MTDFPWKIKSDSKEEMHDVDDYRAGASLNYIRAGESGFYVPKQFLKTGLDIFNLELRPTDIFVTTFPKSGTTWVQELVWLIANDHDYKTASERFLHHRFRFLESELLFSGPLFKEWFFDNYKGKEVVSDFWKSNYLNVVEFINKSPSPRFIKSHLPLSLLPETLLHKSKVVYVARDPRDVAVSYYYHIKWAKFAGFNGDFKTFWKNFKEGRVNFGPYFPHIKEAWEKRNHPNMLFLFYEELSKNLPAVIRRVSKFFGKPITEEQVHRLCDHLHIDNFRKNPMVNYEHRKEVGFANEDRNFIRKGKVGGWRSEFDDVMAKEAEEWIADNLRDTDIKF